MWEAVQKDLDTMLELGVVEVMEQMVEPDCPGPKARWDHLFLH